MIETTMYILAGLTVAGQIFALILLIDMVRSKGKASTPALRLVKNNAILFSFFVAGIATLGSLFFSEIAQFEPCKFCWFQRILMYPLVIVFGLALARGARDASLYGIALSAVGAVVALYHYLMQINIVSPTTCSVVGYASSCSDSFTMTFGYITIPVMALTVFVLIILFLSVSRYYD